MNKIKLIAIDMDGTWLRNDCTISEHTTKAIQTAIDAGYLVVPTTGRSYRNAAAVLCDYHGLNYFNNSNGTIITDAEKQKMIHEEYIPYELTRKIYDQISDFQGFVELYEGMDAHVDKRGRAFLKKSGLTGEYVDQLLSTNINHENLDELMENKSLRISKFHIVCGDEREKDGVKEKLIQIPGVNPISVIPENIELVHGTWSKADGMEKLISHLGIQREEVMAIGDSNNDENLLRWAGTSVAMGNAPAHIQEISDYVTASNEEDGIVKALYEFLEIR